MCSLVTYRIKSHLVCMVLSFEGSTYIPLFCYHTFFGNKCLHSGYLYVTLEPVYLGQALIANKVASLSCTYIVLFHSQERCPGFSALFHCYVRALSLVWKSFTSKCFLELFSNFKCFIHLLDLLCWCWQYIAGNCRLYTVPSLPKGQIISSLILTFGRT